MGKSVEVGNLKDMNYLILWR